MKWTFLRVFVPCKDIWPCKVRGKKTFDDSLGDVSLTLFMGTDPIEEFMELESSRISTRAILRDKKQA